MPSLLNGGQTSAVAGIHVYKSSPCVACSLLLQQQGPLPSVLGITRKTKNEQVSSFVNWSLTCLVKWVLMSILFISYFRPNESTFRATQPRATAGTGECHIPDISHSIGRFRKCLGLVIE